MDEATNRFRSQSLTANRNTKIRDKIKSQIAQVDVEKLNLEYANTPAITKVAEWSKLDTGVGPSIASGSHKNVRAVTDLKDEAVKTSTTSRNWSESGAIDDKMTKFATESTRRKSPILLNATAENDPCVVEERESQCPINLKDTNPRISQKSNQFRHPKEVKTPKTVKKKQTSFNVKSTKAVSKPMYDEKSHNISRQQSTENDTKLQIDWPTREKPA